MTAQLNAGRLSTCTPAACTRHGACWVPAECWEVQKCCHGAQAGKAHLRVNRGRRWSVCAAWGGQRWSIRAAWHCSHTTVFRGTYPSQNTYHCNLKLLEGFCRHLAHMHNHLPVSVSAAAVCYCTRPLPFVGVSHMFSDSCCCHNLLGFRCQCVSYYFINLGSDAHHTPTYLPVSVSAVVVYLRPSFPGCN